MNALTDRQIQQLQEWPRERIKPLTVARMLDPLVDESIAGRRRIQALEREVFELRLGVHAEETRANMAEQDLAQLQQTLLLTRAPKRVPTHEDVMAAIEFTRLVEHAGDGGAIKKAARALNVVVNAWLASLDLGEPDQTDGAV